MTPGRNWYRNRVTPRGERHQSRVNPRGGTTQRRVAPRAPSRAPNRKITFVHTTLSAYESYCSTNGENGQRPWREKARGVKKGGSEVASR